MPGLLLKVVATTLTLVGTAASAIYVNAHVKNNGAPLHPAVLGKPVAQAHAPGGKLALTPSVHSSNVAPVTSTYAS